MPSSRSRPALPSLLAVALAFLMSGCSIASVQRRRPAAAVEDPRVPDTCTATQAAPIADTVMAAAVLALGYGLIALEAGLRGDDFFMGRAIMGVGAGYAGSAAYGYVSTAQCRRRVAANMRCAKGDLVACQEVKPGWPATGSWRARPMLTPRRRAATSTSPAPSSPQWNLFAVTSDETRHDLNGAFEPSEEPAQPGATPTP